MIVYKFGGASVRSSEGVKNIVQIVKNVKEPLFIVVSAMGKTTNALETVLDYFMKADHKGALAELTNVKNYHFQIIDQLFLDKSKVYDIVTPVFDELENYLSNAVGDNYDKCYDKVVSYGEIVSTTIVSVFLNESGCDNKWLDMRKLLLTDSNFREANVRMNDSQQRLKIEVTFKKSHIFVGQGFIGSNKYGDTTTLGREGSDYTAAVIANLLDAESVTIWKDVPGILNADPRIFDDTVHIPELSYLDAVELAYSGAQVIHPKTIKPLENKQIPLFVRPFNSPQEKGSVIKSTIDTPIDIPVMILRRNQVLITIRPRDFSFVLEESLSKAFVLMNKHRLKIGLIQSSAISISVCVDNSRYLPQALDELSNDFKVTYNESLELLTIRGINDFVVEKYTKNRQILLSQRTRRIGRFLMTEVK